MSTGTSVQVVVDLFEKTIVYTVNILMQLAYRVEGGRGLSKAGYMSRSHEAIERGLKTWISEGKLLFIRLELYSAQSDEAYEYVQVDLKYLDDPMEQVVKAPIDNLEAFMRQLKKLPDDAKFSIIVKNAEGASEVPGWKPAKFKELMGGVSREIVIGDEEHGFGHVSQRVAYAISNWEKELNQQNVVIR